MAYLVLLSFWSVVGGCHVQMYPQRHTRMVLCPVRGHLVWFELVETRAVCMVGPTGMAVVLGSPPVWVLAEIHQRRALPVTDSGPRLSRSLLQLGRSCMGDDPLLACMGRPVVIVVRGIQCGLHFHLVDC